MTPFKIACMFAVGLAAPAWAAPVAGPVTLTGQVVIPAGFPSSTATLQKIPKGFRLVIQTVSYFRAGAANASVGQVFVQTTLNKVLGIVAVPEATANGATYPGATLNTTIYCGETTPLVVNAYRSGNDTSQETDSVTIMGTYEVFTGTN